MKFKISCNTLLKLLRIVSGIIERRNKHNVILGHVLLRLFDNSLQITATNQETEIIVSENLNNIIQTEVNTTVPFRRIYEICKVLPKNKELSIDTIKNKIIITSESSKFILATLPASHFPNVYNINKEKKEFNLTISQKTFSWLMTRTAFSMADQDVRFFLNGMLLEVKNNCLYSVAADGHRLAMNYIHLPINNNMYPSIKVIVPRKGILEIMRMINENSVSDLQLRIIGKYIQFNFDKIILTSKLIDGNFPEYEKVIPKNGDKIIIGNRENLKQAFHRVSILFSEKFRSVRLAFSHSKLKLLAINTERDQAEEYLEVDYTGSKIEIVFNINYLIDFLSIAQSKLIKFTISDINKSMLIEEIVEGNSKGAYVLMPIRI